MGSKVSQKFEEHKLAEDLNLNLQNGFSEATVVYGEVKVSPGDKITPTQSRERPTVTWESHPFIHYTLVMTDVDASEVGGERTEIKHWVVTNIPGSELDKGHEAWEYIPAAPSREGGVHRYAFLLYRQKEKLPEEARVSRYELRGRAPFKVSQFAEENDLTGPIAGNFFLAEYDDSVPEMHRNFLKFPYVFSNVYNLVSFKVSQWLK